MDGGNTGNAGAVSSASRNPGFKGDRLRRCLNRNDAAGRAAAGYFFLFGQEKVTKKKAAPEPPKSPALLASSGREPNSPNA